MFAEEPMCSGADLVMAHKLLLSHPFTALLTLCWLAVQSIVLVLKPSLERGAAFVA